MCLPFSLIPHKDNNSICGKCYAFRDPDNQLMRNAYFRIIKTSVVRKNSMKPEEREKLYRFLSENEVACIGALTKYDPMKIIGFCFGRAMAVHLKALQMGLNPESIKKIFIIGDLKSNGMTQYRFHVATTIKGNDGDWYAFDTTKDIGLKTAGEWVSECRRLWDPECKAKIYLTPVCAVIPDVRIFPEINEEKGEYISELAFNPSGQPDFTKSSFSGIELYELKDKALRKYFLCVDSPECGRFNFVQIEINSEVYYFNDYFRDLLRSMERDSKKK